jgi:hypothetical protein
MAAGKKIKMGTVKFNCTETGQMVTIDVVAEGSNVSFNSTFDPPLDKSNPILLSPVNHMYVTMMDAIKKRAGNEAETSVNGDEDIKSILKHD